MNKENDWDQNVEGDAVEGPVVCVSNVLQVLNEMKRGKACGPPDVSLDLIAASMRVRIQVIAEICHSPRWIWNAS